MPAISDAVSKQALTDLVGIVCRNRDGVPWNASNLTQCIRRFGRFYDAMVPEGEGATWEQLLTAANLRQFCDGATLHTRRRGDRAIEADEAYRQTIGTGSIAHMVNVCKRMLLHMDPSADTSVLETLAAHAESEATVRRDEVNDKVPPFADIVESVRAYASEILGRDGEVDTHALSKAAYALLQVAMLPGRERMLLSLRGADSRDFDPSEDHSAALLSALQVEHPTSADHVTLATVVFDSLNPNPTPTSLVVGVHGGSRKNEFFHTVDLSEPVLRQAESLTPLLHDALVRLTVGYTPETFLLRSVSTKGQRMLNRNWGNDTFRAASGGHTVGTLRKAVEQQAFADHVSDPGAMTLEMCTAVCKRCQHRADTAMTKYVSAGLQRQRARVAGTGLVRQNAVADDTSDCEDAPSGEEDCAPSDFEDAPGGEEDCVPSDLEDAPGGEEDCAPSDDTPGPSMLALIAAFAAAHEADRKLKRRRVD